MVQSTFEFTPDMDRSSLYRPDSAPVPHVKGTAYRKADLGDEFYDLDYCSIVLQQYAVSSQATDNLPAVLIDDVVGVAYYGGNATG